MVPERVTRAAAWHKPGAGRGLPTASAVAAAGGALWARLTTARHASLIGGVLLALAAAGQAIAQAVAHARSQPGVTHVPGQSAPAPGAVAIAEYALPLLVFAMA